MSCSPQIARDALPGRGEPVKPTLSMPGWRDEVLADVAARGHDVDDALREAGLFEHVGEEVRVERRLGRGLQHDRATRRAAPGASFNMVTNSGTFHGTMPADDADRLAAHEHVGAEHAGAASPPTGTRARAVKELSIIHGAERPGP